MCIESISHVLLGTNDAGTIRDAQKIFNNLKIMYELATLQNVTPYAVTIPERKHVCKPSPQSRSHEPRLAKKGARLCY